MPKTIVITSGYFNPVHPGHIECLEMCRELGDELRVIVNSDYQVRLKTGKEEVFQDEEFRMKVMSAFRVVDSVMLSVDQDGSVCASIRKMVGEIRQKF
jgi:D-beta-D-heptose 7-phosphate kinase/D-beta-D-heptose 1-phosphate adenosyltransferase